MVEWNNRNLGCALVSTMSFCHLLLRLSYFEDACMSCLTITYALFVYTAKINFNKYAVIGKLHKPLNVTFNF